jgi:antitoxin component YwqK of YwqJK toxin-antitoxin module
MGVFWNGLAQSHIQNAHHIIEDLKLFGKKRGKSLVIYYKDETVYCECQFDKDLPVGNCIIHNHGGKIMAVDSYVDGKLNGG